MDKTRPNKLSQPLRTGYEPRTDTKIEFPQIVIFLVDESTLGRFESIQGEVSYSLCMIVLILDEICDAHPTVANKENETRTMQ